MENILSLIPQRDPFVMVDKVVHSDDKSATTSFFIKETNIFCENGFLREPALIENMAQTAAARAGFEAVRENKPAQVGFIGSIKNLSIHFFPKTNTEIHTEIQVLNEIFDVTLISGKVIANGKIAAECEMTIVIKN